MDVSKWIGRPDPPTLPYLFALDWLERAAEKPWFGDPYVRFGPLLVISMLMFETGAVLGHALRERLPLLTIMLADPWGFRVSLRSSASMRRERAERLLKKADDVLYRWANIVGAERLIKMEHFPEEPRSFFDLYIYPRLWNQASTLASILAARGLADWQGPADEFTRPGLREFFRVRVRYKEPVITAYPYCEGAMEDGLGTGAKHPQMTDPLWRSTWEHPDEGEWQQWASLGLPLEKPPEPITFQERQESLLSVLRVFVDTYYPELVEPLFGRQRTKPRAKRRARREPRR